MATFRDLYPDAYVNNTPQSDEQLGQQAMAAQPPKDLATEALFRNAPMNQAPQGLTLENLQAQATNLGSPGFWKWERRAYEGRRQALNDQLALYQVQEQRRHADRDGLLQGMQALQNANKIPAGNLRKAYLETLKKNYKALTGADDTSMIDFYAKASDEEAAAFSAGVQQYVQDNPELGIKDVSAFANNPDALFKILETATKVGKLRAEAAADKAFMDASPGVSVQPTGGTSPQPGTSTPAQPNVAPGGPQGPLNGIQEQFIQEAQKQGVDPALVLAIVEGESNFRMVPGDGGKAAGYGQLHQAAATDAGKALGMDPNARHTPEGNVPLTVQYIKQVLNRAGGNPQGAMALYNWGRPEYAGQGNPQYVTETNERYGRYTKTLGGRPVSRAAQNSPEVYQSRLAELNQAIATRGAEIQARGRFARTEGHQRIMVNLQRDYDNLVRERDKLEAQAQRVQDRADKLDDRAETRADRIEDRKARLEASAAQGVEAEERKPMSDADRKNLRILDPITGDSKPVPAQWTQKDFKEATAQGVQLVRMEPVEGKAKEAYKDLQAVHTTVENLLEKTQSPKVQEAIGNIVSNPDAWLKRLEQKGGKDLDSEVIKYRSQLARMAASLQRFYAGTAQSAAELKTLAPFLVNIDDPTPGAVKAKLEALLDATAHEYNTAWQFDKDLGVHAPKLRTAPKADKTGNTTIAAKQPLNIPGQPPRNVSPAVQKALNILNGN